MEIKIRIPRIHVVGLQKIDDMKVSLGILVDEDTISLEFNDKYSEQLKCKGPQELCLYASKALSSHKGLLLVKQLSGTIDEIDVNLYKQVLATLKLVLEKKSFTISDVLTLKSKILGEYELDPIIACAMYFGGINLAIWRNPLKPSCLRLPSTNKYIEVIDHEMKSHHEDRGKMNLVAIALSLWLNEFSESSVVAYWSRREKHYKLVHYSKPRPSSRKLKLGMIPIEVSI